MPIDYAVVENFKTYLSMYENGVTHINGGVHHRRPILDSPLGQALHLLTVAGPAEIYLMMEYLLQQIRLLSSLHYSETTLTGLLNLAVGEERRLIKNILQVSYDIVHRRPITLDELWLAEVGGNVALQLFMMKCDTLPPDDETSYSGNSITEAGGVTTIESGDAECRIALFKDTYIVKLRQSIVKLVAFILDKRVPEDQKDLSVEVIITPETGYFILDSSIHFIDDAQAQLFAGNCLPNGYTRGTKTWITLPGSHFSAAMLVSTWDFGKTWVVSEFNILPPSNS